MPEYRLINNGYVDASLSDQELSVLFRNLRMLRQDAYNDFEIVIKGYVAVETLRVAKRLTGNDFDQFLKLNFDNGNGPLANLVRDIVHYLNGKQGHQTVLTSIRMCEHVLEASARARSATYQATYRHGSSEPFLKDGYSVEDYDLYRLAAGIGPAAVGRIFLLLGGENYYG
jgi:hypothetical protein